MTAPGALRTNGSDRLGRDPDVLPGGHLIALSQSAELAAYLLDRAGQPLS